MSDDGIGDDLSELLDGDVLGEEPGDPDRPGATAYPPDRPLGVEDPSLYDDDDLDTRATLRRDVDRHVDRGEDPAGRDRDFVLVDVSPEGALDHESALLAEAASGDLGDDMPAEEAAIHVVDTGAVYRDDDPVD